MPWRPGDSLGRLTSFAVVILLGAAAGFTVRALTDARPRPARVVDAEGTADLSHVVLRADTRLVPVGGRRLTPGKRARYSFTITNLGTDAIRHLVARSVRVAERGADDTLDVASVSDPACSGVGRVECIFQQLSPGETRTVRVVLNTSRVERPRDRIMIHTFIGRFTGPVGGSIPLEVVGDIKVTTGRFG